MEGAFPLESLMDELARRLKMDPLDIRMKNYAVWLIRAPVKNILLKTLINAIRKEPRQLVGSKVNQLSRKDATKFGVSEWQAKRGAGAVVRRLLPGLS